MPLPVKIMSDPADLPRWKKMQDLAGKPPKITPPVPGSYLTSVIWENGLDLSNMKEDDYIRMEIESWQRSMALSDEMKEQDKCQKSKPNDSVTQKSTP